MWFDRTVLRVSLVAGSVVGAIVLVKLFVAPSDRAPVEVGTARAPIDVRGDARRNGDTAPPAPAICETALDEAQRTLAQPNATDETKVSAVERLSHVARDRCGVDAAALTNNLARAYHRRADKAPEMRPYAERLYDAYLAAFPDGPHAGDNLNFRAELAWSRADAEIEAQAKHDLWARAAAAFDAVVAANRVDAPKRKEAAYAAVLAWKNAINSDHPAEQIGPGELPSDERSQIAAIHRYRDIADGAEAAQMTFLEGSLLRRFGRLDDALPLFLDILDHHRSLDVAEYSANLALDTYDRLGRHAEMVELARRLMKDPEFLAGKPDLAATLARIDRIARGPHAGEHYQP